MAKNNAAGRNKSPRNPDRVRRDKISAYKNKQAQRKRHAEKYPNDTTSLKNATRWTEIPKS